MLLIECLVLTTLGTAGGLLLAAHRDRAPRATALFETLTLHVPAFSTDLHDDALGGRAVAVATCVACGLAPALRVDARHADARPSSRAGRQPPLARPEVSSSRQVAASALLLTICLTLLRGLQHVAAIDPGFDVQQGISARDDRAAAVHAGSNCTRSPSALVERLEQLPQAQSVSFASLLPLGGDSVNRRAELRGPPPENGIRVGTNHVGPRFFETLGMTVRGGREFLATDRVGAPAVAIVNESFAKRAYPNQSALGHYIRVSAQQPEPWREIVGIVSDSKYGSLSEALRPQVFLPYLQTGGGLIVQVRMRPEVSPALGLPAVRVHPRQHRSHRVDRRADHRGCDQPGVHHAPRRRRRCSRGWARSGCCCRWSDCSACSLEREPRHAGDRHPNGARRIARTPCGRRVVMHRPRGCVGVWRDRRHRGRGARDEPAALAAGGRASRRSRHADGRRRRAAAHGRCRQLHPRASRQPHRSGDGAAPRLIVSQTSAQKKKGRRAGLGAGLRVGLGVGAEDALGHLHVDADRPACRRAG